MRKRMLDLSPDLRYSRANKRNPMNSPKVTILTLTYSIRFRDSDEGNCYAGDGMRILSVHTSRETAEQIASEFNPILSLAEKETVVYPVQKFNRAVKAKFGFTLDSIDDGYDFKLKVEDFDVE